MSREESRLLAWSLMVFALQLGLAALASKGYFSLESMPSLLRQAPGLARLLDAMHRSLGFVLFLLIGPSAAQGWLWWSGRRGRGEACRSARPFLRYLMVLAALGLAAIFWFASTYATA